LVDKDFLLF